MKYNVIDTGVATAQENMAFDRALLKNLTLSSEPILHFYDWEALSATHGYFIRPESYFTPGALKGALPIARRPTGGGVLFHGCDFTFSLLLPASHPNFSLNTLQNYHWVNEAVRAVLETFLASKVQLFPKESVEKSSFETFCMGHPMPYDLIFEGKKIGGGAQRKSRYGFLHQGTLALTLPSRSFLEEVLLDGAAVAREALRISQPLLKEGHTVEELKESRRVLKELLKEQICSSV